jgi:hypothetical protein
MTINNSIINIKYNFDTIFNNYFSWIRDNSYIKNFILLFLTVYPSMARPTLPNNMEKLFENQFVRFILIAYVIYDIETTKNIPLAITISLLFLILIHQMDDYYYKKENNTNKK